MNEVVLRPLAEADLPVVLMIEGSSFSSPWTQAAFVHELQSPHSCLTIAERAGAVLGYLCCWYVADEVQILNVAVHPNYRRQGVAERLLRYALDIGQQNGAQSANLEVRRSNLPAIQLYKKFGFREAAVRRGYYADGEDALSMVRPLLP
ncbi:MAG: ribosomal protein S18-alanine N-acetyltransferase [Deltaproteobacteria bacterium]|nr:ribosomal protein S18-alanine N-acetyltransferase [Deltaproteobacteria bacterium]